MKQIIIIGMLLTGSFVSGQTCGADWNEAIEDLTYEYNTGFVDFFRVDRDDETLHYSFTDNQGDIVDNVCKFEGGILVSIYSTWTDEGGHYTDWFDKCE